MRTYLLHFLALASLLSLLLATTNWMVDPYAIWNDVDAASYAHKPLLIKHERLHKAHRVEHVRPLSVILGTSRAEIGLSPEHPALAQPAYNLGLSGTSIYESFRYLQHAQAVRPLRQAILAIDFLQFNAKRKTNAGYSEARMRMNPDGSRRLWHYEGMLDTLLSDQALHDSYSTKQDKSEPYDTLLPDGRLTTAYRQHRIIQAGGHRQTAMKSEKSFVQNAYADFIFSKDGYDTLECFRSMLEFAYRNGIEMHVLISPSHARQWELIAQLGLWPEWEKWKREILHVNLEVARKAGRSPYPIWDFSGYSEFSTEQFPAQDDAKSVMHWYWESSHFRSNLGQIVLDTMFGRIAEGDRYPAEFGVLLSRNNIEQHLQQIRRQRQEWMRAHPNDVAEIKQAVHQRG